MHPGHGGLNIAVLLLLHQALPGPSTNRTALNRMEVKLVFCLGFKVPLLPLIWPGDTGSELLVIILLFLHYNLSSLVIWVFSLLSVFFWVIFTFQYSHCFFYSLFCPFSFPLLTLCDLWHVVVLTVTVWLSGVLQLHLHVGCCLHLQAILPGPGNLSCGWLPWEQMFLMPLVGGKALKVTP